MSAQSQPVAHTPNKVEADKSQPIPWRFIHGEGNGQLGDDKLGGIVSANDWFVAEVCRDVPNGGAANAELICRAVNCHQELVDALKEIEYYHAEANANSEGMSVERLYRYIDQIQNVCSEALARAEARP